MDSNRAQMSAVGYFLFKDPWIPIEPRCRQSGTSFSKPCEKTIRQDFRGSVLEIREGVEPQIWGTTSFRTSGAWFSKSVKGLSLKFGGQPPSDMKNEPMDSDQAQMPAVRNFVLKTTQRKTDTAACGAVKHSSNKGYLDSALAILGTIKGGTPTNLQEEEEASSASSAQPATTGGRKESGPALLFTPAPRTPVLPSSQPPTTKDANFRNQRSSACNQQAPREKRAASFSFKSPSYPLRDQPKGASQRKLPDPSVFLCVGSQKWEERSRSAPPFFP
ncbi:hypothetical protein Taro_017880 [Colocasia esculenta]|uniref:Uncharacterized protein n=1 Tax=Colocasia esculenta TaxID=4460 RepID=A0A843UUL1_COLES|nr:hypothetical protein [Colocasia esculenta]